MMVVGMKSVLMKRMAGRMNSGRVVMRRQCWTAGAGGIMNATAIVTGTPRRVTSTAVLISKRMTT